MKKMTLERAEKILRKKRQGLKDVYSPLSSARLSVRDSLAPLADRFKISLGDEERGEDFLLTDTALNQLCSIAGVPVQFLERVPASLGLKMLLCMVRLAEEARDRQYLFRLKQSGTPRLRAILPQNHVRLDDLDVVGEIRAIAGGENLFVENLNVSEDCLFLRILFNGEYNLGGTSQRDNANVGIDVITSETGRYPLQLRHVVYRQVCSNGITQLTEGNKLLKTRLNRMDRNVLQHVFRGTLETAIQGSEELVGTLSESHSQRVRDPKAEVTNILRDYRLGSPRGKVGRWVADEIVRNITLFGLAKFDIIQAFTAVARGLDDHRLRMRIEDSMADYLMKDRSKN